jgi:hypothetical protein
LFYYYVDFALDLVPADQLWSERSMGGGKECMGLGICCCQEEEVAAISIGTNLADGFFAKELIIIIIIVAGAQAEHHLPRSCSPLCFIRPFVFPVSWRKVLI